MRNIGGIMYKRFLTGLILLSFVLVFSSCGSGGSPAPANSTISVTPGTQTYTITGSEITSTQYFLIVVKNANGILLDDVELTISFVWATPSETGLVTLFDGDVGGSSPINVKTDEEGSYILRLDFKGGTGFEYSGNVFVISGSVSGSAEFEVAESSED